MVCIDQTNDQENNHQVAFMSRIYDPGSQTLVWLGETGDRNDHEHSNHTETHTNCVENAMQLIQSINKFVEDEIAKQPEDAGEDDAWDKVDNIFSLPSTQDSLAGIDKHWDCTRHFFARPYFSRSWVLGKVGVSARVRAFYGTFLFPVE